jgi:hypothetical protein
MAMNMAVEMYCMGAISAGFRLAVNRLSSTLAPCPCFRGQRARPRKSLASRPLDIQPAEVATFDEETWYRRAFRGEHAPQLTLRAVVLGSILGFLLAFTNLYVGLKTGWGLGVAITACIVSFSLWNLCLRIGLARSPLSILESNCMQSTASAAGYSTGSTMVSATPALLMLSVTTDNPKRSPPALAGAWRAGHSFSRSWAWPWPSP